jgi:DnaJ-class molecular chaperone
VSVDTPTPLIKKLRLRLAQLYHPDVSESICNSTKMAELNAAYDAVMKEREKRR